MDEVYVKVIELGSKTLEDYFKKQDIVSIDELVGTIEDLLYEIDSLKEELDDLKDDMEENYEHKKFNPYHEYGLSEKDFH